MGQSMKCTLASPNPVFGDSSILLTFVDNVSRYMLAYTMVLL